MMGTETLTPAPPEHLANSPLPVAPAVQPKAPRFFRATVANPRHPTAPHVKGYVLIGSAWPRGAKAPCIFAERVYVLPMGDSFCTHEGEEICKHVERDNPLWPLADLHGAPIDEAAAVCLKLAGLDIPTKEEGPGAFSTAHLIAWSK